jgi:endo-1,4-beta-xylanase
LPLFGTAAEPSLKDTFKDYFLIGAALNERQFTAKDPAETMLILRQFSSTTPENALKWESVHPEPDEYRFEAADKYVAFGESNRMFIIGHTLIWYQQTPSWVFRNDKGEPASRDLLLARMRNHIHTVVGRYKGRVKGWDVVNEALADNGMLRASAWQRSIGDDFIIKAFEFAHAADPDAELYYNDYSLENPRKRNGAIELIKRIQAAGVKITGVGLQDHNNLNSPTTSQLDETISAFAGLGLKVMVTEMDIDVLPAANRSRDADITMRAPTRNDLDPYTNGLPASVQQKLATRYADLFTVFVKHRHDISRVTFWGVTDAQSWLNNWPVHGRTAHPLLFDRAGKPKPAFWSVLGCVPEKPACAEDRTGAATGEPTSPAAHD